ncbi:hypothetical protein [Pedobacter sp.]|jgi:Tfp pilus assembly protein PilF|uniref:hypothetical protein n=1 Tax=Pedobacter sp. TaxID=1411316 RepID=UPI002B5D615A|nr:hypothetical protein [Pedobacter sp.]HWW43058.1 hypothetical protein [Pedobacter sp.]
MDILYTVEEKYLQAVEELNYGELPKALHYFNEIINAEPDYARAHYQLGCFYHYQFKNFQTAGYHYQKCVELEPEFPDVYEHYLKLVVTLKMHKLVEQIAEKALAVPGANKAQIYENLGIYAEEQQDLQTAKEQYKKAALSAVSSTDHSLYQDHIKRITAKKIAGQTMTYTYDQEQ